MNSMLPAGKGRCWWLIIFLLFSFILHDSVVLAEYVDDEDLEDAVRQAEEELFAHKKRIRQVQAGLRRQQEAIVAAHQQEMAVLDELASFDEQIMQESRLLVEYFQQAQEQKELTREKEREYKRLEIEKEMLRVMTQRRLAAYYRMGDIGVLNITFSADTLPDLVNFHEYYHHLLRHDRELIDRFRAKMIAANQAHIAHEEQRKKLEEAMARARGQRDTLAAAKIERRKLLAKIKVEQGLHKEASAQLSDAVDALLTNLQKLEKKADLARQKKEEWMVATYPLLPHKKRKPAWMRGFGGQRGKLASPVAGEVVGLFGGAPDRGGESSAQQKTANGIEFKVEPDSLIKAVFRGKVIYAGFVNGYGLVVIISHTDGFYTLTSGVSRFLVAKGDIVEAGDPVAKTSGHVGELAEQIHFEIRHHNTPLDPIKWFDLSQVVIAPQLAKEVTPAGIDHGGQAQK